MAGTVFFYGRAPPRGVGAYLSSTFAPTSSLLTPSLTGFGAASTRSFASLRPSAVMARTSLITSIFLSPIAARTTVNSVCSSTGAAAATPAAGAAAIATAAAAETPHFASSSLASSAASRTVSPESSSTIFSRLAIERVSLFSSVRMFVKGLPSGCVFGAVRPNHPREFGGRRVCELRELGRRRCDEPHELRTQFVEGRQERERLDPIDVERRLAHGAAQKHELLVILGESHGGLGRRHRIARMSDQGR